MVRLGSRLGDGAMIVKMSLMAGTEKPSGKESASKKGNTKKAEEAQDLRPLDPTDSQGSTVENLDSEALATPKKKQTRSRKAKKGSKASR